VNLAAVSKLGDPTFEAGRLKVWVRGRRFPLSDDYWDGNWMSVTAYYHPSESSVVAGGPFVHLGELWGLYQGIVRMHETSAGEAKLECLEPNLSLRIEAGSRSQLKLQTSITPDHLSETHSYEDELDLSYLPAIIASLSVLFSAYPIKEFAQHGRGDA
jgi:hypothetical protein